MSYVRLSAKEKQDLYNAFEAGMKLDDIRELTGRSHATISRIKKLWRDERKASADIKDEPEVKAEEPEGTIANSDYARAYMSGDSRWNDGSLDIQRSLRIQSRKTNILYEMDNDKEIRIHFSDGTIALMTLRAFERFADESVDVLIVATKYAKSLKD